MTLTASAGSSYLWSRAGQTTASDHGQCEWDLHRDGDGCDRVQRDEREPKCDGQSVAAVATHPGGPTTFCAGRERDADGQCWERVDLWSPGGETTASDHGQCQLALHRDGDGRGRVQRDERDRR